MMKIKAIHIQKEKILKKKIIRILKEQGFSINPHLRPREPTKQVYRKLQEKSRREQLSIHKKELKKYSNELNVTFS